ncbi:Transcription factor Adf-1 [Merluccius polli]|uniref:Transcription factor Adf-1 n=1 Tax=Merluccius polli TaxID=89951 RepID=A0AA47MBX8_MERPO|nr:Transcription factor Adf-1 [Merluccius polli]KAK0137640.1 Transcription factor Adf-1 [Merluccius polli]
MEEKLILAVSSFPVIFNIRCSGYKDRNMKMKAWLEVSKEVGLGEDECRKKWKGLRDTYLRERRKETEGKRSGSAAGAFKKWKFSAILSFLDPFVTPRETSSNMGVEEDRIAEDQGSEAAAGTASDTGEDVACSSMEEAAAASEPTPPPPTPPLLLMPLLPLLLLLFSPQVLRRPPPPAPTPAPAPALSADEHFLQGLLPSLQRLPPHAKEEIKFQIHKLLYEANSCYNSVLLNLDN